MQRSVKAQLYRALTLQPRTKQTSIYKYTTHTKEDTGFVYYGARMVLHLSVQNLVACWLGVVIMTRIDRQCHGMGSDR